MGRPYEPGVVLPLAALSMLALHAPFAASCLSPTLAAYSPEMHEMIAACTPFCLCMIEDRLRGHKNMPLPRYCVRLPITCPVYASVDGQYDDAAMTANLWILQTAALEPEQAAADVAGGPAWQLKKANMYCETRMSVEPHPRPPQPAYFAARAHYLPSTSRLTSLLHNPCLEVDSWVEIRCGAPVTAPGHGAQHPGCVCALLCVCLSPPFCSFAEMSHCAEQRCDEQVDWVGDGGLEYDAAGLEAPALSEAAQAAQARASAGPPSHTLHECLEVRARRPRSQQSQPAASPGCVLVRSVWGQCSRSRFVACSPRRQS